MKFLVIDDAPAHALEYESCGIDRVFVDLETLGKQARQGHLNTPINQHQVLNIRKIRESLQRSQLLVRVNPLNSESKVEIDSVISLGAEIVMLPMISAASEVREFVRLVGGRARTSLLFETGAALTRIDEILSVQGIDECYIGLNDLSISLQLDFTFEPLAEGLVDYMANHFNRRGLPFGFGGIGAAQGNAPINPRLILSEHKRLGSSQVILSRSFMSAILESIHSCATEIMKLRQLYDEVQLLTPAELEANRLSLVASVREVTRIMQFEGNYTSGKLRQPRRKG